MVARHLIVGVDAGLDGGGVGLDVERLVHADVGQLGTAANGSPDLLLDGLAVGTGGETAVQRLDDAAILHINTPANDGQGAKGAISALDAKALTGRGAVQLLDGFQVLPLGVVAEVIVQQVVDHQPNGVHGTLRHGGVAALAPAADTDAVALRLQRDVGGIAQFGDIGLHQSAGTVRHRVVGDTAHKLLDLAIAHRADQLAVELAFLTVADGELRVRGKAEDGSFVVLQIVVHIAHVGLFVVADEGADGIAQGDTLLLEELQGIQGRHHGALIVCHAAADHVVVLDLHGKGVCRPAIALRHHVHMADGCQILFRVRARQLGIADVIFTVAGGKAHACRQLQGLIQGCTGAHAVGSALRGLPLHAVDGNEGCNVLQDLFFVRRNKRVDLLVQCLIHVGSSFLCRKRHIVLILAYFIADCQSFHCKKRAHSSQQPGAGQTHDDARQQHAAHAGNEHNS